MTWTRTVDLTCFINSGLAIGASTGWQLLAALVLCGLSVELMEHERISNDVG